MKNHKTTNMFKYYKIFYNIMTTQINLRLSNEFLEEARIYAKNNGFLNIQEFFREAAREKVYNDKEIKSEYIKRLQSKEANTFLSKKESKQFEKELEMRAKLK